jgi:branched-chain amino acid transport system substrate-binding protein
VVQAQFRGIVDKNLDQWREPGKQVIISPAQYKTGDVVTPFEKARGGK